MAKPLCDDCGFRHYGVQHVGPAKSVSRPKVKTPSLVEQQDEKQRLFTELVTKPKHESVIESVTPKRGGKRAGAGRKRLHANDAARVKAWRERHGS